MFLRLVRECLLRLQSLFSMLFSRRGGVDARYESINHLRNALL